MNSAIVIYPLKALLFGPGVYEVVLEMNPVAWLRSFWVLLFSLKRLLLVLSLQALIKTPSPAFLQVAFKYRKALPGVAVSSPVTQVSQLFPVIGIMTRVNLLQVISYNYRKAFVGKHLRGLQITRVLQAGPFLKPCHIAQGLVQSNFEWPQQETLQSHCVPLPVPRQSVLPLLVLVRWTDTSFEKTEVYATAWSTLCNIFFFNLYCFISEIWNSSGNSAWHTVKLMADTSQYYSNFT